MRVLFFTSCVVVTRSSRAYDPRTDISSCVNIAQSYAADLAKSVNIACSPSLPLRRRRLTTASTDRISATFGIARLNVPPRFYPRNWLSINPTRATPELKCRGPLNR